VHDTARSTMYANEIAEIRKMAKITLRSELALEQVGLRLATIKEFGDVAATMGTIAGVVAAIKNQVHGVIPQVGYDLGDISESLNKSEDFSTGHYRTRKRACSAKS